MQAGELRGPLQVSALGESGADGKARKAALEQGRAAAHRVAELLGPAVATRVRFVVDPDAEQGVTLMVIDQRTGQVLRAIPHAVVAALAVVGADPGQIVDVTI